MLTATPNLHDAADGRKARQIRAARAEIALRYDWLDRQRRKAWEALQGRKYRRGDPRSLALLRLNDLQALFATRYGATLPYDDAGRDDLEIAAHHVAYLRGDAFGHIVAWARDWLPDMPRQESEALAKRIVAEPRKFRAATLGWRLHLTDAERTTMASATRHGRRIYRAAVGAS